MVHSVAMFMNVFLVGCSCVNQMLFLLQWSKIVPGETETEPQSSVFVEKLVAVAVWNMTYQRAIIREHAGVVRCLEGN